MLQLLIEDVTGTGFSVYVRDAILRPLGMESSDFDPAGLDDSRIARAHDARGRALPRFRFAELAAAGLYTSASDLALLARASMVGSADMPYALPPA